MVLDNPRNVTCRCSEFNKMGRRISEAFFGAFNDVEYTSFIQTIGMQYSLYRDASCLTHIQLV